MSDYQSMIEEALAQWEQDTSRRSPHERQAFIRGATYVANMFAGDSTAMPEDLEERALNILKLQSGLLMQYARSLPLRDPDVSRQVAESISYIVWAYLCPNKPMVIRSEIASEVS